MHRANRIWEGKENERDVVISRAKHDLSPEAFEGVDINYCQY
jgi:hypothetical protein